MGRLMASVTKREDSGRSGFRIRFYCDKRQREIYLPGSGKKAERLAERVAGYCETLARAKASNVTPDPDAQKWANGTDGALRDKLVGWDLADPVSPKLATDEGRLLGPFIDAYIKSRTDIKTSTAEQYTYARKLLVEYFGERHPLRSITPSDADRWRRWMVSEKGLAVATVSKYVKRAKTMVQEAVSDRLLPESPFANLKGGNEANKDRHFFVDRPTTDAILAECPDHDWKLIFALPRFAGLRCPSEVTGLRWADILWDKNRIRIDSPKTGLRFCPIFEELRPILKAAFDDASEEELMHNAFCIRRYRGSVNLSTGLHRIMERAGVTPWPKTFINLRSTRRTELQEKFPDHVVNAWLGHSGAVAAKHYLQVTDDHWNSASGPGSLVGSLTGSLVDDVQEPAAISTETKKPRKNGANEGLRKVVTDVLATPLGLEPRMTEPKSVVLPITPRGRIAARVRSLAKMFGLLKRSLHGVFSVFYFF